MFIRQPHRSHVTYAAWCLQSMLALFTLCSALSVCAEEAGETASAAEIMFALNRVEVKREGSSSWDKVSTCPTNKEAQKCRQTFAVVT